MLNPDSTNEIFTLAAELVNYTSQHIFLTGKAGTGKTTFLKYIRKHTHKQNAVVAPTGVAAINAGGVTMHSFFQLPFEPFIPVKTFGSLNNSIADKNNLFSKIKLSNVKREVMEELELLIIDEASMLRSDKLDAIDAILRGVRKKNYPFGGVQILFIGDMYQLPPVTNDEEWDILKEYYASPFFFDAHVMKEINLVYVELKKIYRQKEQQFIDLLNNIRHNTISEFDFELLHTRYFPDYTPDDADDCIIITTHNYKADAINNYELKKLPGQAFVFKGAIEGEFNENALPAEMNLVLKPGAHIMFIKNDKGDDRKYYNGKLAIVKKIYKDEITVSTQDTDSEFILEKETWENIRYTFNKEKNFIEEEQLGKFIQYPIRLAWAITIHKSQGLTFENVIIDAGQSFAAGQVYVALSRCTTLDGMILLSGINPNVINTDERIAAFAKKEHVYTELKDILEKEKRNYLSAALMHAFDFTKIISRLEEYPEYILQKNIPKKSETHEMAIAILENAIVLNDVAKKFSEQLRKIFQQEQINKYLLEERVSKGIIWFAEKYSKEILQPLYIHLENASKIKLYLKHVNELYNYLEVCLKKLFFLRYDDIVFIKEENLFENYSPQKTVTIIHAPEKKEKKSKPVKGDSPKLSLQLYKDGLSVSEIAKLRNLANSTIEGHLGQFVLTGDVDVYKIMPEEKVNTILKVLENPSMQNISELRNKLGSEFSYGEIRAVLNHWQKMEIK